MEKHKCVQKLGKCRVAAANIWTKLAPQKHLNRSVKIYFQWALSARTLGKGFMREVDRTQGNSYSPVAALS